jgi:hypothetical protein
MSNSAWMLQRMIPTQLALAFVGMAAFVVYSRSWKDLPHLIYDIPASFAVFAFIAQLLLEVAKDGAGWYWAFRFALLVAITVATVGREFFGWPLSGHLTCMLAVALVQAVDTRLPLTERALYWIPLPILLLIRAFRFDGDNHWPTYYALIYGACVAVPVMVAARFGLTR